MKALLVGGRVMDDKFIEIYNLYKNDIFRLSLSYTGKISDAEDIVQNVFIKIYNNLYKLNSDDVKKWCMTVTINECKNLLKSFWKKKIFIKDDNNDFKVTDTYQFSIKEALYKLNLKYRIPIYLYYFEGYKIKEIASILNTNINTVKTNLNRGKKKLKMLLEDD